MAGMHAFYRPMGYKTYEMKDWLGAPRLTYSDIKRPFDPTLPKFLFSYKLDYLSATTIYPFGAEIESLSFEKSQYRFGYTGHLKDDIIRPEKGDGANYSTLFREYDPIIGRWWSIDPLRAKYAGMSPYNYAAGNPINIIDFEGSDIYPSADFNNSEYGEVFKKLKDNNQEYNKMISKYAKSKTFNLNLNTIQSEFSFDKNRYANTITNWRYNGNKIVTTATSVQEYSLVKLCQTLVSDGKEYKNCLSEIAKAAIIIHEGIHSYVNAKGIYIDAEHNTFNEYHQQMLNSLTEYNNDFNLGYTPDQLNELSFLGTNDSKQFKTYIQGIADKNKTNYDTEMKNYTERIKLILKKENTDETKEKK